MKDFQLTNGTFGEFVSTLQDELAETGHLVISTQSADTGKWGMARLWRAWMSSTGEFMAKNGCVMPLMTKKNGNSYGERSFNGNDAHELFTNRWLGVDAEGNRLSWAKASHDGMRAADKGERFMAMLKHEEWATEKGIILIKPRDSEYSKLEQEQTS